MAWRPGLGWGQGVAAGCEAAVKPAVLGAGEVSAVGAVPGHGQPLAAGLAVPGRVGGVLPAHHRRATVCPPLLHRLTHTGQTEPGLDSPGLDAALPTLRPSIRLDSRRCGNHRVRMDIVAAVVIVLLVVATGVVVIGVFIWAAVKDGQEDKALQARLRIRRRTRLGR